MIRARLILQLVAWLVSICVLAPAAAQVVQNDASDVVTVTLMPGWRDGSGIHVAALKFALAPGWKTYWRAPGDGGIATQMDWSGSSNLGSVGVRWPTPAVFRQNGMRSIGYRGEFVLPIEFQPTSGGPIMVDGHLKLAVCEEVCLPVSLDLHMLLPPEQTVPVVEIAAALRNTPISAAQAEVRRVNCRVFQHGSKALMVIELEMPPLEGRGEAMVIEAPIPSLWIGEPTLSRQGDILRATAKMATRDKTPFTLDLDHVRITLITTRNAVDIKGCR